MTQTQNKAPQERMFEEIYNCDPYDKEAMRATLFSKLHESDTEFYSQYIEGQPQSNIRFVDSACSTGSTRYQRLQRAPIESISVLPHPPAPPAGPPRDYSKDFMDHSLHFRDSNLNVKAYSNNSQEEVAAIIAQREKFLIELDTNQYQNDLLALMKQPAIQDDSDKLRISNQQRLIEQLGGIEDTVEVMEEQLKNLQAQSLKIRSSNTPITVTYQQLGQQDGSDKFLKSYAEKVKPIGSFLEHSKHLREEMIRKLLQQSQ